MNISCRRLYSARDEDDKGDSHYEDAEDIREADSALTGEDPVPPEHDMALPGMPLLVGPARTRCTTQEAYGGEPTRRSTRTTNQPDYTKLAGKKALLNLELSYSLKPDEICLSSMKVRQMIEKYENHAQVKHEINIVNSTYKVNIVVH